MFNFIRARIFKLPLFMRITFDNKVRKPTATIIFLHGISATSKTWRGTIRQLADDEDFTNVRLLSMDLLGFGKSPRHKWQKYNYREYTRSLRATLRRRRVKTPVILVGHSMGALIAAEYSAHYSIHSLVLVSAPIILPEKLQQTKDQFYRKAFSKLTEISNDPFIKYIARLVGKVSTFQASYFDTVAFDKAMHNLVLNSNNYNRFVKLSIPTTIIAGYYDPLATHDNLNKVADKNPNITFVSALAGHDMSAIKRKKAIIAIKGSLDAILKA
jgi:pimeloyl-ACP methyl ester carboxylesterase